MSGVWGYRDLLVELIRREILVRYRHSLLGIGWALLQPLGLMLLFTFVFTRAVSAGAIKDLDVPYPLFVYVGVLPWTLFAAGLSGCVNSLTAQRDLVTKIYFPHQILPLSAIASALFDFLVASALLGGLAVYYGLTGGFHFRCTPALILLPAVLAVQLLLMVGLGLWLALGNLWFRDVKYVFAVGIQMWMFLTNVLYPLPAGGGATRVLTAINPMVPIISAYRAIILEGRPPDAGPMLGAAVMAVVLAAGAWLTFTSLEGRFAERV
ncbi:MAG: ABC transporter permease [Phycisphaerae bacterium]|jgi:ABC-type polysaccharide/polyol phosphate export permease